MLVLKILGAVLAVGLGVWLGLPGRYKQTPEEIEELMARGEGTRKWATRHFTPLDWLRKDRRGSERRAAEGRRRFTTAAPRRRDPK